MRHKGEGQRFVNHRKNSDTKSDNAEPLMTQDNNRYFKEVLFRYVRVVIFEIKAAARRARALQQQEVQRTRAGSMHLLTFDKKIKFIKRIRRTIRGHEKTA
jgi:hypothetical protein